MLKYPALPGNDEGVYGVDTIFCVATSIFGVWEEGEDLTSQEADWVGSEMSITVSPDEPDCSLDSSAAIPSLSCSFGFWLGSAKFLSSREKR